MLHIIKELKAMQRRNRVRKGPNASALAAIMRNNALFIHIPKCGGKSIIHDIYGLAQHDHFGHATIRYYKALLGPRRFEDVFRFALVRDPIERAVSGYNFYKAGGFGGPNSQLRIYKDAISFDQFVADGHLEERSRVDVVFRPQSHFLTDHDGCLATDRVYDFADFDAAICDIRTKCGMPQLDQTSKINITPHKHTTQIIPQTARKVRTIYQVDYDNFGQICAW